MGSRRAMHPSQCMDARSRRLNRFSPRALLEELARIRSHDVVLPTAAHGQIRLRCVAQPDAAQAALLDRLGIVLPKRMRLSETTRRSSPSAPEPDHAPKCSADFSDNALI